MTAQVTELDGRPYFRRQGDRVAVAKLTPGMVVDNEFRPWRIVEVVERLFDLWPDETVAAWRTETGGQGDPRKWWRRPVGVTAVRDDGSDEPSRYRRIWVEASERMLVLPTRYAVCHDCGQLPPCRDELLEREMAHQTERMAELMAILPGFCHGCREPITRRQKSVRFPGENLLRPDLGPDTAVFHTRSACSDAAYRYDKLWAAAEPGRRRRLHCEGRQLTHADGSTECDQGRDCPDAGARHRAATCHRLEYTAGCWCVDSSLPRPTPAGGLLNEGVDR